jgi:hypothetical protein
MLLHQVLMIKTSLCVTLPHSWQVLTALDKAHHLVGFEHGDMRISNIMEHIHDKDAYDSLMQNPNTWQEQGFESAASPALNRGIMTFRILDFGHSNINDHKSLRYLTEYENRTKSSGGTSSSSSSSKGDGSSKCQSLARQKLPQSKGFLEWFYGFWYKGKSDTWRLLRSMATRLDGRAWPKRRQEQVLQLYKLLRDILDLNLEAKFFQDTQVGPDGQLRRLRSNERVYDEGSGGFVELKEVAALDIAAKPRRWKFFRGLREKVLRWWSRFFSRKPQISAREVLKKMEEMGLIKEGGKRA